MISITELLNNLRSKGFEVSPEDTCELDVIINRIYKKCDIKKVLDKIIDYILSKTDKPKTKHIIALLKRQKQFQALLQGSDVEAKQINEHFDKMVEEIESYGKGN